MIATTFPDGLVLLVLDPDALDVLRKGETLPIQEMRLVLGYVKDPVFVEKEIEKAKGSFTPQEIGVLLDAANRRDEVRRGRVEKVSAASIRKPEGLEIETHTEFLD